MSLKLKPVYMVAATGFEPVVTVSKTAVLTA